MLYIMGRIPSPPPTNYHDLISLLEASHLLERSRRELRWLERRIPSLNSGVLEIVQPLASLS